MSAENDLDAPLWGAEAIAPELHLNEKAFYHKADELMKLGAVTKVGATYLSSRRRIRRFINGEVLPAGREAESVA